LHLTLWYVLQMPCGLYQLVSAIKRSGSSGAQSLYQYLKCTLKGMVWALGAFFYPRGHVEASTIFTEV
jgi:hypothetical protein